LNYPVIHQDIDIDEIQSLDAIKVVTKKVKEAYRQIKKPVMVEDVSITIKALGNLPGPYFKAFLTELKTEGICRLLDGYDNREATVQTNYAYYDGKTLKVCSARLDGTIADKPRGDMVFGSDAIFIPRGHGKTWCEMDQRELEETMITLVALNEMREFLENNGVD
jgi:non-canonical purine NTP pyrophosphatase (RdgB/HAM1 family)